MTIRIMTALSAAILLSACTGNSSTTRTIETEEITDVSGRVGAAIVRGRTSATPISLEGAPVRIENDSGDIVFEGPASLTDDVGDYRLTLENDAVGSTRVFIANDDAGPVAYRCEVPSGCGDINYKAYVNIDDGLDLRAGVGEISDGMRVNINWITDIAASLARTVYIDAIQNVDGVAARDDISEEVDTSKTGAFNEYSIELANLHVSELFNISDIISVTPVGPSQMTTANDLSSGQFAEGLYYGALLAALPEISRDNAAGYMGGVTNLTNDVIARFGQLLEKSDDESLVTLARIFEKAIEILQQNMDSYRAADAQVPSEAVTALGRLTTVLAGLEVDQETSVSIDVPESLANWTNNIATAKLFISDLTEALNNFWGENPEQSSFVDPEHARRMDTYYQAHDNLFKQIAPDLIDQNGALGLILEGADYLVNCQNGSGGCGSPAPGFEISDDNAQITIDGSLALTLEGVGVEGATEFSQFDLLFDETLNSLTLDGTTYTWSEETISDGSVLTLPYLRLFYDQSYSNMPSLDVVSPNQIALIWPSVVFNANIENAGDDSGSHRFEVLLELNLVGVSDPVSDAPIHYNPFTVVFWVRSDNGTNADGEPINNSAMLSQLLTENATTAYPNTRWPQASNFFDSRDDAAEVIPDMVVSLYRGTEVLDGGELVDVFDQEVIDSEFINRVRVYPYDSERNVTRTENCGVTLVEGERTVTEGCDDRVDLAGEVLLDDLIAASYRNGTLIQYPIQANGIYEIDLNANGDALVTDGEFNGLELNQTYGPFDGTFVEPALLGINRLEIITTSNLLDGDTQIPLAVEFTLQRKTVDLFSTSLSYAFAPDDRLSDASDVLGVGLGSNAQAFYFEYLATEEEVAGGKTIEIERGLWNIYRSGVNLGSGDQSFLTNLVSRTEYTQGTATQPCGVNNRDKAVSEGDCDAVAYLTFRGGLLATIREERPDVFVARFVDGSWMVLGGS